MRKLSIGIQTFSKLIQDCIYVDKTAIIYHMIMDSSYCFLARPRRFGKSLLVSTLAEIFRGNKDLFSELAISKTDYNWQQHPVVMISFSSIPNKSPQELERGIKVYLQSISREYGIELDRELTSGEMLRALVMALSKQNSVVLLIDEYDYAILQHIHNPDMADQIREVLKNFYIVIKDLDPYLRFVFLTGVSKFSKTSIFSGLNNLEDVSLDAEYNDLLGYTHAEIQHFFEQYLIKAAEENNCSVEYILAEMTSWYDGYRFTRKENAAGLYNPFSVLLFLSAREFSNYWFRTGTPTFLINLLKSKDYPIQEFDHIEATERDLDTFDIDNIPLKTLLFQTGYLTIEKYDKDTTNFTLTYPNKEVIKSLAGHIIVAITNNDNADAYVNRMVAELLEMFRSNNVEKLAAHLTHFFATIPYTIQINQEKYYQTIFYLLFKLAGAKIIVEEATNIGRIDAVLETKNYFFIIEFKINDTAIAALKQIEEKKYHQSYQGRGKDIMLVGIAFDTHAKNVSAVEYMPLNNKKVF